MPTSEVTEGRGGADEPCADTHAIVVSSPAGFAELVARTGTPARLVTPDTQPDFERFMAVTTELGDVTLGPPGMTPAQLAEREGAS